MKTVYVCDHCGMEFEDYKACLDHEDKDHVKVSYAKPIEYNGNYPSVVHAKMDDDAIIEYTYNRMVEPANEAEEVA